MPSTRAPELSSTCAAPRSTWNTLISWRVLQARSMLAARKCPCGTGSDTSLVGLKRGSCSEQASEALHKHGAGPQAGSACGDRAHRNANGVCCDAGTADALEEAAAPAPKTLPDCCS